MSDISALTFFAPMAFDLQLDGEVVFSYEEGAPWPNWTADEMASAVGLRRAPLTDARPRCRLSFRSVRGAGGGVPVAIVDQRFDDLVRPTLRTYQRVKRTALSTGNRLRRRRYRQSVVAVTIFSSHGPSTEDELEAYLDEAVATLGDYVVSLGMMSHDVLLGFVSKPDLPTPLTYLEQTLDRSGRARTREHGRIGTHVWDEELWSIPRDEEDLAVAGSLFRAAREGDEPAFPILAMRHRALRELLAGRTTMAVIAAAQTGELLVDLVLARSWIAAGGAPVRQSELENEPLKPRMREVLGQVTQATIDLTDASSPPGRWLRDCYELRKDVIHRGTPATVEQASAAIDATYDLIVFVGAALEARARTRATAGALPVERFANKRYGHLAVAD